MCIVKEMNNLMILCFLFLFFWNGFVTVWNRQLSITISARRVSDPSPYNFALKISIHLPIRLSSLLCVFDDEMRCPKEFGFLGTPVCFVCMNLQDAYNLCGPAPQDVSSIHRNDLNQNESILYTEYCIFLKFKFERVPENKDIIWINESFNAFTDRKAELPCTGLACLSVRQTNILYISMVNDNSKW